MGSKRLGLPIAVISALALALCVPCASQAQTTRETDAACERAWLASDWPTDVVQCSSEAQNSEADRITQQQIQMNTNLPAEPRNAAVGFAADDELFAGEAWARAAVGYAKLKKQRLYEVTRQKALADIRTAISENLDEGLRQKALNVRDLVASPLFLIDAPDSEELAHI